MRLLIQSEHLSRASLHRLYDQIKKIYRTAKIFVTKKCPLLLSLLSHPRLFGGDLHQSKTILVMGHQRCGSTLLAHILNSNPDICGYLETHLSYRTYSDVRWLWAFIRFKVSPLFDPRQHVALDKIVDNSTVLSSKVVHDERIRFVFIVREPSATLASQVNSFKQSVFFAEKKYLSRMRQLQAIAASVSPDRSFVVRHDDLIHRSDDVLRALTSFLKLSSPLQSSYRVENLSGKEWFGDTSSAIREGKIRVVPELPCVIPPKILERCQNVYMETCEILRAHCTSL